MTERLQHDGSARRAARRRGPRSAPVDPGDATFPAIPAARIGADGDPTILGFRVEPDDEPSPEDELTRSGIGLVALRRPDRFASATLVLAGLAANVSLVLPWGPGDSLYGLTLVQQGVDVLGAGLHVLAASDLWPPLGVVVAGGLLAVLGLLLLVPARTHRLVGVMALVVAAAAVVAVVYLLADAGWRVERSQIGMWCAAAVPGLGLLGALKAMLTPPRITIRSRPAPAGSAHPVDDVS